MVWVGVGRSIGRLTVYNTPTYMHNQSQPERTNNHAPYTLEVVGEHHHLAAARADGGADGERDLVRLDVR